MRSNTNSGMKAPASALAALLAMIAALPATHAADDDLWQLEITPYLWGAGIDGEATVSGQTVDVDKSFSDILDALDVGGEFLGVYRYRRFVLWTQIDYLALSTTEFNNLPLRGKLETDVLIGTLGIGYQFPGWRPGQTVDVLIGARHLSLDNHLELNVLGTFDAKREFTDPVLIVRPSLRLSSRWRFNPTFSFGSGDSEKTYELQPQAQFQVSPRVAMRFGYRMLYYDTRSNNDLNRWDGKFEGPFIGIGGTFGGGSTRPVKSTPPPSPPPPPSSAPVVAAASPPPPPDTDRDGILDAQDQCPSTTPGERVDAIGCAFDLRLAVYFDTDSAVLKPDSHADLNRAADLLKRVPTMAGTIEGHSDATGSDAYNLALSERRARAVADYLFEQGIDRGRLDWKGYGKSQPIADNATAEGRAKNRRVVLHRSDRGT